MYVCLCHGITDRDIRRHCARSPSCSAAAIYRERGTPPKCGKCVALVRTILKETQAAGLPMLAEAGLSQPL